MNQFSKNLKKKKFKKKKKERESVNFLNNAPKMALYQRAIIIPIFSSSENLFFF